MSFVCLHVTHKQGNITDKGVKHAMLQTTDHKIKGEGAAPAIKGARGMRQASPCKTKNICQEGMTGDTFFCKRSTSSVLRDPRQTSVCGGLLRTEPTQRQICLDALQCLFWKIHPYSHPSSHQYEDLISGLVNSM